MNESNTFWRKEYKDTSNTLEKFAEVMKKYEIKNGEAQIKRDVVFSAWKKSTKIYSERVMAGQTKDCCRVLILL